MGQALITRKGGSSKVTEKTLETLGFINVPKGEWVLKIGTKSISAKDSTIIPICVESVKASAYSQHTGGGSVGNTNYTKINNINAVSGSYSIGGLAQYNNITVTGSGTGYNIFLPLFYSMDLSATQNGYTSGTLSAWLEEVGGVIRQLITYLANIFRKEVLA